MLFCETAAVPIHVNMEPPLPHEVEQKVMAELTRANAIVDRLVQTSPNVIHLLQNKSAHDETVIEHQLGNEFEAALYQGGVPPTMVPGFVQLLAHTTVAGIYMVGAEHGLSIPVRVDVYFLCKTVKSLYKLAQMILSGFMHFVFAVTVESVAHTTVDVYVYRDEFNTRLLCLTSPQHKGLS